MTKKDYQAIARAIYAAYTRSGDKAVAIGCLVDDLCDVLAADNPRFDRERFIEACETGRCKGMPAIKRTGYVDCERCAWQLIETGARYTCDTCGWNRRTHTGPEWHGKRGDE